MKGESKKSSAYLEGPEASLFIEEELKSYPSRSPDNLSDLLYRLIWRYLSFTEDSIAEKFYSIWTFLVWERGLMRRSLSRPWMSYNRSSGAEVVESAEQVLTLSCLSLVGNVRAMVDHSRMRWIKIGLRSRNCSQLIDRAWWSSYLPYIHNLVTINLP